MRLLTLCAFVMLIVLPSFAASPTASDSLKPYNPFDEPKPRLPQEILSDSRLDQKVKICVKTMNFRQFFAEMSAKTGVKLSSARDVCGERPILYIHNKSLRDVMIELSNFYGYHWLVSGKKGQYQYEIFEDVRHAKYRDGLKEEQAYAQAALLHRLAEQVAKSGIPVGKFKQDNPYECSDMELMAKFVSTLDTPFLSKVLVRIPTPIPFKDLSPQSEAALVKYRNDMNDWIWTAYASGTADKPKPKPISVEDLASSTINFRRVTQGTYGFLRLEVTTNDDKLGKQSRQWPSWSVDDSDFRQWEYGDEKERLIGASAVPDVKITKSPDRVIIAYGPQRTLLLGDLLQAIAEQSGRDVIGDFYYQEFYPPGCKDKPLVDLIREMCAMLGYTCKADESILRFRFDQWFFQRSPDEPPARLIESCWKKIETVGRLEMNDILDIVTLPQSQFLWPGFRYMPGANSARKSPATLKLWSSLRPDAEVQARTPEGVKVSELNQVQFDNFLAFTAAMGLDTSNGQQSEDVIKIATVNYGEGGDGSTTTPAGGPSSEQFTLVLADGSQRPVFVELPARLSEKERSDVAAQRLKDAEEDKIEVLD